jgi:ribonuclease HII
MTGSQRTPKVGRHKVGRQTTGVVDPTDHLERELFAGGARYVAGIDEVGRGSWAGPVSVGVAVVDVSSLDQFPDGVRDSKMLTQKRREELFPFLVEILSAFSIGHASPLECDQLGMTKALHLATSRAMTTLCIVPDVVVLDGMVNYVEHHRVMLKVGADRDVRVVAGASVIAKVTRDRMMIELDQHYPEFKFAQNKGYPTPAHLLALESVGLTDIHRRSWSFADRYTK